VNDDAPGALQNRVAALTDTQRRALAEAIARDATMRAPERLTGFIVIDGASSPSDSELRDFLAERLPPHMIPARFVTLQQLPRSTAGKLDRRALAEAHGAELSSTSERVRLAPRPGIESTLAAIWKDVLKVEEVGVDDDFFEIGGDSLLSIRLIAQAARAGIAISPERFFARPTIRHLAARGETGGGRAVRRPPLPDTVGDAPLTPIQHWFLHAIPRHRDWWNQSYLLESGHALDAAQLREIVRVLIAHHDALRLRLVCRDGQWHQEFMPPDEHPCFRVVALDTVSEQEYAVRIVEECEREQATLRIRTGSLFRVIFFHGAGTWRRILLLGHHLVLDGVSWNVILEDLATLVGQAASGEPLRLPERAASARAWAHGLAERAARPDLVESAAYWLSMAADGAGMDEKGGDDDAGDAAGGFNRDARLLTLMLGAEESRLLLQEAPRRLDVSVQALLLGALLLGWRDWGGGDSLRLDLEGHGRDVLGDTLDVSRTVGWFTTVFPVQLAMPAIARDGVEPSVTVVKDVQKVLDALPLRGAAHGLLRYLSPDAATRAALASQARPALLFNHLGRHDLTLSRASRLRVTDEPTGVMRSPDAARPYLLELNSRIEDGVLIITIEYSRDEQRAESIARFAVCLRDALETVARAVPAPFGLDASALNRVALLLDELDEA
jgi:non-ribosomal peptide synthase protein (TIGR01720 family)